MFLIPSLSHPSSLLFFFCLLKRITGSYFRAGSRDQTQPTQKAIWWDSCMKQDGLPICGPIWEKKGSYFQYFYRAVAGICYQGKKEEQYVLLLKPSCLLCLFFLHFLFCAWLCGEWQRETSGGVMWWRGSVSVEVTWVVLIWSRSTTEWASSNWADTQKTERQTTTIPPPSHPRSDLFLDP